MSVVIRGRFQLVSKIGSGSFGDLYQGADLQERGEAVAVKLEPNRSAKPQLQHEFDVYQHLIGAAGFAQAKWYGTDGDFRALVIDLLGPNLSQLLAFCGGRFSLKTVLMLGDQMVSRLETLHERGLIHGDIKPQNFLMGLSGVKANTILFHGNIANASELRRCLEHFVQSRRDDMESMLYLLLYMLQGGLPWSGISGSTPLNKEQKILDMKFLTPPETLCENAPREFAEFLRHCRSLQFEERPNYDMLRGLLRSRFTKEGFTLDYMFDWTLIKLKLFEDTLSERAAIAAPTDDAA